MYLCTMKAYFFNYSHDLCMANHSRFYLPPRQVLEMEGCLMPLAAWVASPGDWVVTLQNSQDFHDVCQGFYREKCPGVQFCSIQECPSDVEWIPWGIDALLWERLRKVGMESVFTWKMVEDVRRLSSRQIAAQVLRQLKQACGEYKFCGESFAITDEQELRDLLESLPQSLVKAPWSGSGRGLRFCYGRYEPPLSGWCRHVLEEQGCIMVEPLLNKLEDFAAEFRALPDGRVCFEGISFFQTTSRCTYIGNKVATQMLLRHDLFGERYPEAYFDALIARLERILSETLANRYVGPLGVDMMLCREDGEIRLHPCVEFNLRRTMGWLALHLPRLLATDVTAVFKMRYEHTADAMRKYMNHLPSPLFDEEGRLMKGALPLVPCLGDTRYSAWLAVTPAEDLG